MYLCMDWNGGDRTTVNLGSQRDGGPMKELVEQNKPEITVHHPSASNTLCISRGRYMVIPVLFCSKKLLYGHRLIVPRGSWCSGLPYIDN